MMVHFLVNLHSIFERGSAHQLTSGLTIFCLNVFGVYLMKSIKVLGMGCSGCRATAKLIAQIAEEKQVKIELQNLEEVSDILDYGLRATPAVVINEQIVHMGGTPVREQVSEWF